MPSAYDLHTWREREVIDMDGEPVGHAEDLYADDRSGEPAFLLVRGGRFGNKLHFVPLDGASLEGEKIRLGHTVEQVNSAPHISADEHLTRDEERRLFAHYGMEPPGDEDSVLVIWVAST
jgi:hypothetical protein